jgi:preprotein translocase subunit SecY
VIESFRNIFAIPDLRKRVIFTFAAPGGLPARLPDPDAGRRPDALASSPAEQAKGTIPRLREPVLGRQHVERMTIFALGIMPYISASIILQLLTVVWPYLERCPRKASSAGKKITQYTRYGTWSHLGHPGDGHRVFLERTTGRPAGRRWCPSRAGASGS